MTSLSLILAPLMALQGVGQAPVAIANDTPETWTLEYPRLIQPFVEDYRRCLSGRMRQVRGEADFEIQHRSDVPSCEEVSLQAQDAATAALAGRSEYSDYSADDVREIFEHIGRIHIARGADLDQQFTFFLERSEAAQEQYEENKPRGLVLELHDASVVKARTDATAEAAEAAHQRREQETEARGAND
jgi:hypothetical protein